jgi:glycosyltransferase involved in cell wall biosynthesis
MISIIIRTYNEEKHLNELLNIIQKQSYNNYEVILVDSGSTDNTIKIASRYKFVNIVNIKKEDFTFGYSLNKGIEVSKGDYCVMISGHCIPTSEYWLDYLIKPFDNISIGISYGRQIGTKDTKFSEHQIFSSWFPNKSDYKQKNPFSNNANCAIRKSIWKELGGYDEIISGLEDLVFAKKMLEVTNYKIAYESKAIVYHIHEENWSQIRNRYYREAITFNNINPNEKFSFYDFLKISMINIYNDIKKLFKNKEYNIKDNLLPIILFRINQFWGTYKGYKFNKQYNELRKKFYYPK